MRLILPALILVLCLAAVPAGAFTYAPMNPLAGQEVQFTDTSYDPDGSVVAWAWEFGDGSTSNQQNPTHSYVDPGLYTVIQVITDDSGISTTCRGSINVSATCMCDGAVLRVLTNRRPRVDQRMVILAQVVNNGPDTCCFEVELIHPWAGTIDSKTVCLKAHRSAAVTFWYTYQPADVGGGFIWQVFARPADCADPMLGNNVNLARVIIRP